MKQYPIGMQVNVFAGKFKDSEKYAEEILDGVVRAGFSAVGAHRRPTLCGGSSCFASEAFATPVGTSSVQPLMMTRRSKR